VKIYMSAAEPSGRSVVEATRLNGSFL